MTRHAVVVIVAAVVAVSGCEPLTPATGPTEAPRTPEVPAKEKYPDIYKELTKELPYAGGDIETCGTWQTIDREEARELVKKCPPLTRGDLG